MLWTQPLIVARLTGLGVPVWSGPLPTGADKPGDFARVTLTNSEPLVPHLPGVGGRADYQISVWSDRLEHLASLETRATALLLARPLPTHVSAIWHLRTTHATDTGFDPEYHAAHIDIAVHAQPSKENP